MKKHKNRCFESLCLSYILLLFLYFSAFFAVWAFFTAPLLFYILLRFVTAKVLTKLKQNGAALPLRFAL